MKALRLLIVLGLFGLGMLCLCDLSTYQLQAASAPKLKIEDRALLPQIKAETSSSPIVQRVSPSVVNIYTSKKVKLRFPPNPFFNDPMFRQFFGDSWGGGSSGTRERREQALGSGVIVTEDGYILTNNHVVDGADEIKVALADDKSTLVAKVIGTDRRTDIAVLKVEGKKLPAITITDSDKVDVGDFVLAIGNPFGVGQAVTAGLVSGKGRGGMGIVDYEDFIQTDASINPGNSGGALVDAEGRLVGINTAILSRSGGNQGVGFAVPANLARSVMEQILKRGRVVRGYLGVSIQVVTPELRTDFAVPEGRRALVGGVTDDGAAAEAGLQSGDVIISFEGKPVADSRSLKLMVGQSAPGEKVELKVLRDGKERTFTVTLKDMPDELLAAGPGSAEGAGGEALRGVTVTDIDADLRRQFDLPASLKGALISSIDADSAAYDAGLRRGDVIQEINRKTIASAEDAERVTKNLAGKRLVLRVWSHGGSRFVVVDESKEP